MSIAILESPPSEGQVGHLSSKGQITLPLAVRRKLGLLTGDAVLFEPEGARAFRIRKAEKIDIAWTRSIESTLSEWTGTEDDDL